MINLDRVTAFLDNIIWIIVDENNRSAYVVDPGMSEPVNTYLKKHNLKLKGIFVTHKHYDHVDGVSELKSDYQCKVYGGELSPHDFIDYRLSHGEEINFPKFSIRSYLTKGHTEEHVIYHLIDKTDSNLNLIFTGDTLFNFGCGRVFTGDYSAMFESLNLIKSEFAREVKVCAGHDYIEGNLAFVKSLKQLIPSKHQLTLPTTLATELEFNPFLKVADIDSFKALRVLKDQFKA